MNHLLAAEGSNPLAVELMPIVTSIVVFVVFFFVLKAMVWPKILRGLDDREEKILGEIRSAEEAREAAKKAQEDYETSLADARAEAGEMIARAKADAKTAADELRTRNEAQLSDMKSRAAADIESAKQSAVAELHAEAATLAASIAGRILQREVTVDDQDRLVRESLEELRSSRNS